ncbi:MAG: arginine--tRNA ligase [Deltaproteobacteria bacterium]|nr:arginine--tRNA ligase [Deltaproteobacteria bacterium]
MKKRLVGLLNNAVNSCIDRGLIETGTLPFIELETPKDITHGDYASNVAMVLASRVKKKMPPRKIAEIMLGCVEDRDHILERIEIAGPGFINFFIRENYWATLLKEIDEKKDHYGTSDQGRGRKILVEFVSANPTGPLHIGHGRGAVVGDVLANILGASGYAVFREYYINDTGNQMNNLGRSVFSRYLALLGETVDFPEGGYQGDYIRDFAERIMKKDGDIHRNGEQEEVVRYFTQYAAGAILDEIKEDLRAFGVVFENYFSEKDLYRDECVEGLLADLESKGFIYHDGETRWFKTTDFGDEKDRVVIRKNGEPTYFAADIAYHQNKYARGFDTLIDIWGADHHGYIPRMLACIQSLGYEKDSLKIVLVQLVNLLRDGKPVAMSTRAGEFVTLREVVDEVGRDAARYNFLMRRSDSHLDFDLELAKKQSNENPVYYVQYAHARICSILRFAEERGYTVPTYGQVDPNLLNLPEEIQLIKVITRFPELVEGAALNLEPHRLTFYLNDLAAIFHSYYNKHKVISDDERLSLARIFLVKSVRTVVKNTLGLLGVTAPEKM